MLVALPRPGPVSPGRAGWRECALFAMAGDDRHPARGMTRRELAGLLVVTGGPFLAGAASYVVLFPTPSAAAALTALIVGAVGVVLEAAGVTGLVCELARAHRHPR